MTFKHLSTHSSKELVSSTLAISKADVKSGTLSQGIYKRRLYQCMLNLSTAKKCHYQVEAGLELIVHLFFASQGFTALTEEGRRSRQVEEQRSKVEK